MEARSSETRRLIVLGSTGSIGRQTLDVVDHLNALAARHGEPPALRVVGLAAGSDEAAVLEQGARCRGATLALAAGASDGRIALCGPGAAARLVAEVEADLVVGAIVGSAGLGATLAAVERGADVAIANKETLVAGGGVVIPAAQRSGSRLLPLDSEHSGLWQCLGGALGGDRAPPVDVSSRVRRAVLTASGGPFRERTRAECERASVEEALAHPTWSMGQKNSIDSATLMNKALELVEAHWLFGLAASQLEVLIHPTSIVHAMVEAADGSVLAQLSPADMRLPIQLALTWPRRSLPPCERLDFARLGSLEFAPVDARRFPAVELARRAIESGGLAGAILNAANEQAVELFVAGEIAFGRIDRLVEEATAALDGRGEITLESVVDAEARTRAWVLERAGRRAISR